MLATTWTDEMTAVATAVIAIGTIGVLISAAVALRALDQARHDREVDLITELGRRWDDTKLELARIVSHAYRSVDFAERVREWLRLAGADSKLEREILTALRVPNFFEDLGLLVSAGSVDADLVYRQFGSPIRVEWGFWRPSIEIIEAQDPGAYREFRKLAEGAAAWAAVPVTQRAWWKFWR